MSKADSRHEAKKILETKSNIMEKASRRASALNLTRLCPTLVLATGSSTLRSVRLQELNVTFVILATTAEEIGKAFFINSFTTRWQLPKC